MAKAKSKSINSKILKMGSIAGVQKLNDADCYYICKKFIDTGNYVLNALMSGEILNGLPVGDIVSFSGDEQTGKSYILMQTAVSFLKSNPEHVVYYIDSEGSIIKNFVTDDVVDRFFIIPITTSEELKFKTAEIVKITTDSKMEGNVLICVDSLGNLSSEKEIEDVYAGKDKNDMTKAKQLKAFFRIFLNKFRETKIACLVSNHTYDKIGSFTGGKEQSGGKGSKYGASTIFNLTKSKEKDKAGKQKGILVKLWFEKTRWVKSNFNGQIAIIWESGINRYSGLLELMESVGVVKKDGTKYVYKKIEAQKSAFRKQLKELLESDKREVKELNDKIKEKIMLGTKQILQNSEILEYDNDSDIEEKDKGEE